MSIKFKINRRRYSTTINQRRPGQSSINTPRDEKDKVKILSGTEFGITLGTPICAIVKNNNIRKQDYKFLDKNKYKPRPSHADFTYLSKYGTHASSGGGRSSARETIGRVIAGSIAEKYLMENFGIEIVAYVSSVGNIKLDKSEIDMNKISKLDVDQNIVRFPNNNKAKKVIEMVEKLKKKEIQLEVLLHVYVEIFQLD